MSDICNKCHKPVISGRLEDVCGCIERVANGDWDYNKEQEPCKNCEIFYPAKMVSIDENGKCVECGRQITQIIKEQEPKLSEYEKSVNAHIYNINLTYNPKIEQQPKLDSETEREFDKFMIEVLKCKYCGKINISINDYRCAGCGCGNYSIIFSANMREFEPIKQFLARKPAQQKGDIIGIALREVTKVMGGWTSECDDIEKGIKQELLKGE